MQGSVINDGLNRKKYITFYALASLPDSVLNAEKAGK
jgi:hypothetical protein